MCIVKEIAVLREQSVKEAIFTPVLRHIYVAALYETVRGLVE